MKRYTFVLWMLIFVPLAKAQTGGNEVYKFLNLPVSARVSALGGKLFSIRDNNPALALMNPSMLNPAMHTGTSLNLVDYFSDALYGHLNYIHHFNKIGTFDLGLNFASYGAFQGYDVYGNETGAFTAADFAVVMGYGKELVDSMFSMGLNAKWIFSNYENYFSAGLAVDFAASYYSLPNNLSLTLLIGNVGTQITTYADVREKIPFEIQLAISQRLKHLPVRYSITLQHLQKWNMAYTDPTDPFATIDAATEQVIEKPKWKQIGNTIFRHLVFALEILPVKYISLQLSYNFNVREEMKAFEKKGIVGFAYGAGIHVYHFDLYYARSHTNLASVPNHFTISTRIGDFLKNKN